MLDAYHLGVIKLMFCVVIACIEFKELVFVYSCVFLRATNNKAQAKFPHLSTQRANKAKLLRVCEANILLSTALGFCNRYAANVLNFVSWGSSSQAARALFGVLRECHMESTRTHSWLRIILWLLVIRARINFDSLIWESASAQGMSLAFIEGHSKHFVLSPSAEQRL
jgi:hypothetical protein